MSQPVPEVLKQILRKITTFPEGDNAFNDVPASLRARALKQLAILVKRLKQKEDLPGLLSEIAVIAKVIRSSACEELTTQARQRMAEGLQATLSELEAAAKAMSPIRYPQDTFNPFAPKVVGELIANTLLSQDRQLLEQVVAAKFYGAGVYAIYYTGPFDAYRQIAGREHPIYIGKSDPAQLLAVNPKQQGMRLFRRLDDHHRNLSNIQNLDIKDFDCRFLVVHSAWVKPAEDYLIEHFHPVWNREMKVCFGFGKHGDASSTRANKRSPWDILHPGRGWATSQQGRTVEQVEAAISEHFAKYPVTAPFRHGRHAKQV